MFDSLLESRARRTRRTGSTIASVVSHGALIALAVVLTANASVPADEPPDERAIFLPPPPPPMPPAPQVFPVRTDQVFVATPQGTPAIVAPIDIPDVLPAIDLSRAVTTDDDFTNRGVRGGRPDGVVGGTAPATGGGDVFTLDLVDKPVVMAPGSAAPAYPDVLRSAGIDGSVLAQFVVDTLGRVEPASLTVLETAHPLFADAVRRVLPRLRFLPAEAHGRKVRQLVQQPFVFGLNRE